MNKHLSSFDESHSINESGSQAKRPFLRMQSLVVLGAISLFAMEQSLRAVVPPVPAAFPNVAQTPGTLLYRSPTDQSRITNIIYHNGWFYTNVVTGSAQKAWNFSNPNAVSTFGVRQDTNMPLFNDHGNHAHTKIGDWVGGVFGMDIRRTGLGVNALNQAHPEFATLTPYNATEGHALYWPWKLPFHWIQYAGAGTPTPTQLTRPKVSGPAGPQVLYAWNSLAEDGVTGNSILLGNLLFITSDDSNLGILCYDISPVFRTPAERPILLDKLTGGFGAYIAVPFEHYIVLSDSDSQKIEIIDYQDPTDLKHVASIDVRGDSAKRGDESVSYVQAQDNFIFAQRHKINMDNFLPVLELSQTGVGRPAGSVAGNIDTSQYAMPLGNLLFTGGYSFGNGFDRLGIWAHQATPDTKKPYVGYHMPRPGQTNFPVGAPISLLIHETLESFTIINGETVILREVGTSTPIDCWISFSHDDVLTITPKQYLAVNKTYEVIVVDGGIKDAVGNGIEPYTFTFSTGASVAGGNASPNLSSFTASPSPTTVGTIVTLSATATDPESNPLQYRFTFGDASATTAWSSSPTATRAYDANGHYDAKVQVRDLKPGGATSTVTKTLTVTIAAPLVGTRPTKSSPIALDVANRRVWSVNPDADTVTVIHADTNAKLAEYNLRTLLGLTNAQTADPRNVALDASGNAWITCHDADRIAVLSPAGGLLGTINLSYGSQPYGVAMSPDGASAFVTLFGNGILKRYATSTRAETGSLLLGPTPRAIAITGDGSRVLITRFVSSLNRAHIWDVNNGTSLSLTRSMNLLRDFGPDTSSSGRGIINQLSSITLSPDNQWAWITASKMNDEHGLFFTGRQNSENIIRASVVRIRLSANGETNDGANRIDIDNSESPSGVVFSTLGDYAFVTLQGNNEIAVFDDFSIQAGQTKSTKWRFPSDLAPQGAVLDSATNKIFVNNFMARNVSIHDVTPFLASGARTPSSVKVSAVSTERLSPIVLGGKQIFYNASLKDLLGRDAMNKETYISCASCHTDGSMDGRTWDFTQRGEGFRNTTDLRGRAGMGHGNVHWSGNFDEIQDFENDIRDHFSGTGLIDAVTVSSPLGTRKASLSPQLDQLAAYVTSLGKETLPKSPFRNADGTETSSAIAGRAVFASQNCIDCHGGANFTNSRGGFGIVPRLEDVGTRRTSSGGRLAESLAGIDTPTLLGLHATAPYFHDGSAVTLDDVFRVAGGTVYQMEDGIRSGATSIPGFININWANAVHKNSLVSYNGGAGAVTFTNINGGTTAGTGALEFRFTGSGALNMTATVNGTSYPFVLAGTQTGWQANHWTSGRLEGVNLTAGATNTIVVATNASISMDDMTVSTADDLAKAQPHRRVLALNTTDRNNLVAYLQQLDSSSGSAPDPVALATFRSTQGLPADASLDTATPAGDGVANLLKYAFNMIGAGSGQRSTVTQPNASSMADIGSAGLPLIQADSNGRLTVTYVRRKASTSPGIGYAVQFSSTLQAGSWSVNPAATTAVTSIDVNLERVLVTDSEVIPSRRFARVTATTGVFNAPIIISPNSVTAPRGAAFIYAIGASDLPSSYTATGLPPGLSLNTSTGVISGTPTTSGVFVITVGATNSTGTATTTLTMTVSL